MTRKCYRRRNIWPYGSSRIDPKCSPKIAGNRHVNL